MTEQNDQKLRITVIKPARHLRTEDEQTLDDAGECCLGPKRPSITLHIVKSGPKSS